jgi:antitoxin ParD1/3/4
MTAVARERGLVATLGGVAHLPRMGALTISLPDDMDGYLEGRVTQGGYATRSDYIEELIRSDQEQMERLRQLIQEGLDSPIEGPADEAFFEELRADARRFARR